MSMICLPSNAGISAAVADPIVPAASDSESDRSMDPDEARDYADQFAYHDDPDSPGSVNDENSEILAEILESIPACIQEADFKRLSDLLPHTEPVQVSSRTVSDSAGSDRGEKRTCVISYLEYMIS